MMFLTFASRVSDADDAADITGSKVATDIVSELASQVRTAFPDLRFSHAIIEERGGDHRVVVLDATYAFRFPRRPTHDPDLEIAVLRALRGRCEIALPDCLFVDPAGRFAGYRLIVGDELTPRRFALLPAEVRHHVLDQAGRFLATLHALAPAAIRPVERWPKLATGAAQAIHDRAHRLPAIAAAFPRLSDPLAAFYDGCATHTAESEVVLHGDLVDDHLLLAPDGRGLAGIIDFGDVALGDPAQDLLGFWAYGREAVARVLASYGANADRGLLERSRSAFVHYRIGRFADLLASRGREAAAQSLAGLLELVSVADDPSSPHEPEPEPQRS